MFAKSIVLSDAFLDMPLSARCLYFTLGMLADDDGFVGNPKAIMRQCGASQDDMCVLLQKRYVLGFESGVIVIKHWRMNNYLRNDRYHTTTYLEEMETITIDERGAYTEKNKDGIPSIGIPSIGKDSIGKVSLDKDIDTPEQEVRHRYGEYKNVLLSDTEMEKLKAEFPNDYESRIEDVSNYCKSHGKTYKDYLATIRSWARKEAKRENKPSGGRDILKELMNA